mmetsp:Transcript_9707/g.25258  ORF Transcript_9707/g.25258 Transcript_9707/m.25258 type:complete len:236 (-) Transcript_9707:165-872(-)
MIRCTPCRSADSPLLRLALPLEALKRLHLPGLSVLNGQEDGPVGVTTRLEVLLSGAVRLDHVHACRRRVARPHLVELSLSRCVKIAPHLHGVPRDGLEGLLDLAPRGAALGHDADAVEDEVDVEPLPEGQHEAEVVVFLGRQPLTARAVPGPLVCPKRGLVRGHERRPILLELGEHVLDGRHVERRPRVTVLRPGPVVELGPEPVQQPAIDGLDGGPLAALLCVAKGSRPLLDEV